MTRLTEAELFPPYVRHEIDRIRYYGRIDLIDASVMKSFETQIGVLLETAGKIEADGEVLYNKVTGKFSARYKFSELLHFFYLYLDSIS